jgi:hypothetical protein
MFSVAAWRSDRMVELRQFQRCMTVLIPEMDVSNGLTRIGSV